MNIRLNITESPSSTFLGKMSTPKFSLFSDSVHMEKERNSVEEDLSSLIIIELSIDTSISSIVDLGATILVFLPVSKW